MQKIFTILFIFTFAIAEAQITEFPWLENFDDLVPVVNQVDHPDGWSVQNNNNDQAYWDVLANSDISTDNSFSAPNSMHMSFDVNNDGDDWLITPELAFEATAVYQLNFRYRTFSAGNTTENMEVFLLFDDEPIQIAQSLVNLPNLGNQIWLEESIQFSAPITDNFKIAFLCYSDPFQFLLAIDDVQVSLIAASVEEAAIAKLKTYPNPSSGLITIDGLNDQDLVHVLNLQGQQVATAEVMNGQLDLRLLSAGSYILKALKEEEVLLSRCVIE